jgi:hypothetical protein
LPSRQRTAPRRGDRLRRSADPRATGHRCGLSHVEVMTWAESSKSLYNANEMSWSNVRQCVSAVSTMAPNCYQISPGSRRPAHPLPIVVAWSQIWPGRFWLTAQRPATWYCFASTSQPKNDAERRRSRLRSTLLEIFSDWRNSYFLMGRLSADTFCVSRADPRFSTDGLVGLSLERSSKDHV